MRSSLFLFGRVLVFFINRVAHQFVDVDVARQHVHTLVAEVVAVVEYVSKQLFEAYLFDFLLGLLVVQVVF